MSSDHVDASVASVLICDDTAQIRSLLTAVIGTSPGLRVVGEAADGHEAVAQAERLQPDVVLLDLAMPRRTGLDALPDLCRAAPNARIVVFSGFAEELVGKEAIALGATCYLEKGASPDAIVAVIEQTLVVQPLTVA